MALRSPPAKHARSRRLEVEQLEDRSLLSAGLFDPFPLPDDLVLDRPQQPAHLASTGQPLVAGSSAQGASQVGVAAPSRSTGPATGSYAAAASPGSDQEAPSSFIVSVIGTPSTLAHAPALSASSPRLFTGTIDIARGSASAPGALSGVQPLNPAGPLFYVSSTGSDEVFGYTGQGVYQGIIIPAGTGGVNTPEGLAFNSNLFVCSASSSQILEYTPTGGFIGIFAGTGNPVGGGGLKSPQDLVFGPDGNLYVTDPGSGTVMRYQGNSGAPLPSTGNAGAIFTPKGSGGANGMTSPQGLVFGPDGNLYVANDLPGQTAGNVLQINPTTGNVNKVFTTGSQPIDPAGLTFGPDKNLYVADWQAKGQPGVVLQFNGTTGAFIQKFTNGGTLAGPVGIAFGSGGNLYVANSQKGNVLLYQGPSGQNPGQYIKVFTTGDNGTLNNPTWFAWGGGGPPP